MVNAHPTHQQIKISEVKKIQRLDPEYYVSKSTTFKKTIPLSKIAKITIGTTPKVFTNGSTPFYRVKNIREFNATSPKDSISNKALSQKYLAKKGDILLTVKGRVGNAAIVEKEGFFNQNIAKIVTKKINPKLLLALLHTDYIRQQIKKSSTNQMHPYIRLKDLKKIEIPEINHSSSQNIIKKVESIQKAQHKIEKSQKKIETQFIKKEKTISKKITLGEVTASHRLDPEFFLGNTYTSREKIKDLKGASVKIGLYKNKFTKKGAPYLRAKDLKNDMPTSYQFVSTSNSSTTIPNEILLTRVGNIKALCIENEKVVPSDNFLRLNIDVKKTSPHVLTAYLNSPPGQREIERNMQGSKQKRLNKKSLLEVEIPSIKENEVKKITLEIKKQKVYISKRNKLLRLLKDSFKNTI